LKFSPFDSPVKHCIEEVRCLFNGVIGLWEDCNGHIFISSKLQSCGDSLGARLYRNDVIQFSEHGQNWDFDLLPVTYRIKVKIAPTQPGANLFGTWNSPR